MKTQKRKIIIFHLGLLAVSLRVILNRLLQSLRRKFMNVCVEKFENLARTKSKFFVEVFIILSKGSHWCTDLILCLVFL